MAGSPAKRAHHTYIIKWRTSIEYASACGPRNPNVLTGRPLCPPHKLETTPSDEAGASGASWTSKSQYVPCPTQPPQPCEGGCLKQGIETTPGEGAWGTEGGCCGEFWLGRTIELNTGTYRPPRAKKPEQPQTETLFKSCLVGRMQSAHSIPRISLA